jgi:RecA/RadA recombinase
MSNTKSFLSKLRKLDGAVNPNSDALNQCLSSPSPSVNWAFGVDGFGMPFGSSMILWGPPKGGKSIICNAFIGEFHRNDPEAIAVTFNTELRGEFQSNTSMLTKMGVDPDRLVTYDVNQPELIFDRIEKEIAALCQDGAKIKMIIIDSLSAITGRRTQNADTILTQQIGDQAATIKDGLARILPTIRKHKIALIMTAHARAEMDMKEQMRGKTIKMQSSWATKHVAEFFCFVEPNRSKDGKITLDGETFVDDSVKDFMDKAQGHAHKIRFRVEESSLGFAGRTAEFTLDYNKGIINQYEEIFTLAKNLGILHRPNNTMYEYNGRSWRGLVAMLTAIRDEQVLRDDLLEQIKLKDKDHRAGNITKNTVDEAVS